MLKAAISLGLIGRTMAKVTPQRAALSQAKLAPRLGLARAGGKRILNKFETANEAARLRAARANPIRKAPDFTLPDPKDVRFGSAIQPNVRIHGTHTPVPAANAARATKPITKPKMFPSGTNPVKLASFSDELLKIAEAVYSRR